MYLNCSNIPQWYWLAWEKEILSQRREKRDLRTEKQHRSRSNFYRTPYGFSFLSKQQGKKGSRGYPRVGNTCTVRSICSDTYIIRLCGIADVISILDFPPRRASPQLCQLPNNKIRQNRERNRRTRHNQQSRRHGHLPWFSTKVGVLVKLMLMESDIT